jgi:hypothetical protein
LTRNFPSERDTALHSLTTALHKAENGASVTNSDGFKKAETALREFDFSKTADDKLDKLEENFATTIRELNKAIPADVQTNVHVHLALTKVANLTEKTPKLLNTFVAAQKNIALGFHETLEKTADLSGIPFTMWSSKGLNSDNKDWGPVFAARVDYVTKQSGTITFYGKDTKTGHHITNATIASATTMWAKAKTAAQEEAGKAGKSPETVTIKEEYEQFLNLYETENGTLNGSTTSFELAYLLDKGIPFKAVDFSIT